MTRDDIAPDKMEVLSHVEIAGQPIISMRDIISYNGDTHAMVLTDEALERISRLEVPVRGKSFLVCVDERLYTGGLSGRRSLPSRSMESPSRSRSLRQPK